ncbi:MAG: Cold shock protein of CSP family _ SCO4325, partial [uncultured Nocardioidaceae bacterium]
AQWQGEVVRPRAGLRVPVAGRRPGRLRPRRRAPRGGHHRQGGGSGRVRDRPGPPGRPGAAGAARGRARLGLAQPAQRAAPEPRDDGLDRGGPHQAPRRRRGDLPPGPSPGAAHRGPDGQAAARPRRRAGAL